MDDEWEKCMRACAALADRPNRAYRTWTLGKTDSGEPTFELSEFNKMFDEILDEVYGEEDNSRD